MEIQNFENWKKRQQKKNKIKLYSDKPLSPLLNMNVYGSKCISYLPLLLWSR